jgi:hypothetical protein
MNQLDRRRAPTCPKRAVLPVRRYPELIDGHDTLLENSFVVPDAAFADVPALLRAPVGPASGAAAARTMNRPWALASA